MARIELDLAHSYAPNPTRDEDYALRPLTMSFNDGGAYALLGPSGCGKTTMLNIISGLLAPSQGRVRFDGDFPGQGHEFGGHARMMAQRRRSASVSKTTRRFLKIVR